MVIPTEGNLLASNAQVLVNPVNCIGIMGKGLALQFRFKFPGMYLDYRRDCLEKNFRPGEIKFYYDTRDILCVATKDHWKNPSKLEWIEQGLLSMAEAFKIRQTRSVAISHIGCGNGGLSQEEVRPLIYKYLGYIERVELY